MSALAEGNPGSRERWAARLFRLLQFPGFPLYSVVTLGFSQVLLNIIRGNPGYFPRSGSFHSWVILWTQGVPLLILLGLDWAIGRRGRDRTCFRVWRCFLYGMLALCFVRQLIYTHLDTGVLGPVRVTVLYAVILVVVVGLLIAFHRAADRFVACLFPIAFGTTVTYAVAAGLWGPAWREPVRHQQSVGSRQGIPVFMIVFDELSYDLLVPQGREGPDPAEFPSFAALAEESAWFTRATTNHGYTRYAIPTLLSGRTAPTMGGPSLINRLPKGYEVHAIEPYLYTNPVLDPRWETAIPVFFHGRNRSLTRSPLETLEILEGALTDSLLLPSVLKRWVWRIRDQGGDFHRGTFFELELLEKAIRAEEVAGRLWYWHCTIPHSPFAFTAEGVVDHDGPWELPPDGGSHPEVWARYRRQIRLADRMLGRIVSRLKAENLYDRCVLVVTSDHGLRTHGSREPAGYPQILGNMTPRVPLAIRSPGLRAVRSDLDVQHIDLAPTILDLVDARIDPREFDGLSVRTRERPDRRKLFDFGSGRVYEYDPELEKWRMIDERKRGSP